MAKVSVLKKKSKYYDYTEIDKLDARYNVIIGQRSNGKTYGALYKCVKDFCEKGEQFAYVRRWDTEIKQRQMRQLFMGLEKNNEIHKLSKGRYTSVKFYQGRFILFNNDEELDIPEVVFGYAFSLNNFEHDKGSSYPEITKVVFDEFLTRSYYLKDEFIIFCNVLSSIFRDRADKNLKVFMLANTVSKNCPYFAEMGLNKVYYQKQGTIDLYRYGDGEMTVAVEYCSEAENTSKTNNAFFAFDNPRLEMIKTGAWELAIYPHLGEDERIKPIDIMNECYVLFEQYKLCLEYVVQEDREFVYVHPFTREDIPENKLIFCFEDSTSPLIVRSPYHSAYPLVKRIRFLYDIGKFFYSSNEMGEAIRNWIMTCKTL